MAGPARRARGGRDGAGRARVRVSAHWPPRKVVLPPVEANAAAVALTRATGWLDTLYGSPEAGGHASGPEFLVLRVAADIECWYEIDGALETKAGELQGGLRARMQDCMRFGTEPSRPILRWINQENPDLLALGRQAAVDGAHRGPTRLGCGCLVGLAAPSCSSPESGPAGPSRETANGFF